MWQLDGALSSPARATTIDRSLGIAAAAVLLLSFVNIENEVVEGDVG